MIAESVKVLVLGMVTIFIVMAIIILVVLALKHFGKKKVS